MKKKIIISIAVFCTIVLGVILFIMFDSDSSPEVSDEKKIENALKSEDTDELYSLLYSGAEDEPSKEEFAEGFAEYKKDAGAFELDGEVKISESPDGYRAEDKMGNVILFKKKENGKFEMTVEVSATVTYTVYAPVGARVTVGNTVLEYNAVSKCYVGSVSAGGKQDLRVEKEGCITFEQAITPGTDPETRVDLAFTDEHMAEYEKQAQAALKALLNACVDGSGDISSLKFRSEAEKQGVEAVVDSALSELYSEDSSEHVAIGSINFTYFIGESVDPYDKNDGGCVAKYEYEYSYSTMGDDGKPQMKSQIGNALIEMEMLNGAWYLISADFTMNK